MAQPNRISFYYFEPQIRKKTAENNQIYCFVNKFRISNMLHSRTGGFVIFIFLESVLCRADPAFNLIWLSYPDPETGKTKIICIWIKVYVHDTDPSFDNRIMKIIII